MKKTLGGDRLGSGNKMQVDLHNYGRSTHNLGYLWRSTMAAGTLVPCIVEVALPADTFDIALGADVKTHPTTGPLFGSYKFEIDVFEAPIRLYQGALHNNKLGIGMNMANVKLPQMTLTAFKTPPATTPDLDNSQINPSSILKYLGISGIGYIKSTITNPSVDRDFNALPLLAYWDIYKNYFSNKQEEIGAVIHTPIVAIVNTIISAVIANPAGSTGDAYPIEGGGDGPFIPLVEGTEFRFTFDGATPIASQIILITSLGDIAFSEIAQNIRVVGAVMSGMYDHIKYGSQDTVHWRYQKTTEIPAAIPLVHTFPLDNIDQMREAILANAASSSAFSLNDQTLEPYQLVIDSSAGANPALMPQEGLGLKTYQSDIFNNWLKTSWIDGPSGISAVTAISTAGGSFTLDTLNLSKKVYDMLNRIAVSGGTYDDWLDAVYTHDRIVRAETPIYHGSLIKEVIFQEVISNSESQGQNGSQPLGTLAGRGTLAQKHKGGQMVIRVNEPGYIIGLVSLTPRIEYSQGNKWDTTLKTMDDFHKPQLDEIGFQELICENMAWWTTQKLTDGGGWITQSAGKQPAWMWYMTNINRVYGNFAIEDNEMFMVLNRRYEPLIESSNVTGIKDLTTYIDPVKYNHIFAETDLAAQNFWVQIAVDMTVRRKMSGRIMPNL